MDQWRFAVGADVDGGAASIVNTDPLEAADEGVGLTATPSPYSAQETAAWWDESKRPRHAAIPAAGYSRIGRMVGQHLIDIHDHLRGELTELRELVTRLKIGAVDPGAARNAIAQMTIRQNNWTVGTYCASYCRILTAHHSLEDQAVFPHLRAGEPKLAPVLDRLAEEHLVIHGVLEELDRAFVAFIADPGDFGGIDEAMYALDCTLLSHLSYEESQLLDPLARLGFYPDQVS